jgi:hypothetical protein
MSKYNVIIADNKEEILMNGETQSCCPFIQPMKIQGAVGQVQIVRIPCTSNCPHAQFSVEDKTWKITCGGSKVILHDVEVKIPTAPETPKPQSKLVSL